MSYAVPRSLACLILVLFAPAALAQTADAEPDHAETSNHGYTGLINMPDARLAADGTTTGGVGFSRPYQPIFASMTVLPRLEMTFRYTRFMGAEASFASNPGAYGDLKDKQLDFKFVLLRESDTLPQLSVGALDIHGTQRQPAEYLVASKRFGDLDLSVGHGFDRLDGWFGGLRYRPDWLGEFGLVLEYDAFDYANDYRAADTGADRRDARLIPALEFRRRNLGLRLSVEDGRPGARVSLSYPWGQREFVPKTDEPLPLFEAPADTQPVPRSAWQAESPALRALYLELERQKFTNIRLALLPDGVLEARLEHPRISQTGRAVGRAARTLLLMGPPDITGLRITYWMTDQPIVTYRFDDPARLRGYFAGTVPGSEILPSIKVTWAKPEDAKRFAEHELRLDLDALPEAKLRLGSEEYAVGAPLRMIRESRDLSVLYIRPINLGTVFNDPSGALKYDVFSSVAWGRRVGDGLFAHISGRLTLAENVSDTNNVLPPSTLPQVRGDLGLYLDEGPVKLTALGLSKYWQMDERVYARASVGLYDMMFAGLGGEILWLPRRGPWAVAFSLEALRKRDYEGFLGFQDYSTVQALSTLYYRIPRYGVTLSATGGRFLARDEGVRFEFARELRSGFRFGVWYTVTNADLQTYPGSPGNPYHDKGAFLSMPFHPFLTKDSKGTFEYGLAPWLTDVGQMAGGAGLYRGMERTLMLNHEYYNPLTGFGN